MNNSKPCTNSFLLDRGIWCGEYPGDLDPSVAQTKIGQMLDFGITAFIDLTQPGELKPYRQFLHGNVKHYRFPIRDVSVPCRQTLVYDVSEVIKDVLSRNGQVYLHCWGGIGRTGTVAACLLRIWDASLTGSEALRLLRERFQNNPKSSVRNIPDTQQQVDYILNFNPEAFPSS